MSTNIIAVAAPPNQESLFNNPVPQGIAPNATDSDATQTLTYSATGLPTGISIDPATGIFNGNPVEIGTFNVTVTATDTTGATNSDQFTWTIIEPPPITVTV